MPLPPIPESKDFWTAADWVNRGMVHFAHGDFRGAIADYSKAIELEPAYAEAGVI